MTVKRGQVIDVTITDMATGGKGIARVNGMVVFVDHTVPMDTVTVNVVKKKRNYVEARVVVLLEASPFRVDSACRYCGFCGGCKWQFIQYDKQLVYKQQQVKEALEHIGMVKDVTVYPTTPSPEIFGYRNKMEFSCSDRRWLLPHEMNQDGIDLDFALGLHVPGTFHKVLDIETCLLQPGLGNEILNDVKRFIKTSDMPVYGLRSHTGFWRFLMLRHSSYYDQWMVNIITSQENKSAVRPMAEFLAEKYTQVVSVMNNITSKKAQIAVGEYETCLFGDTVIKDRIGGFEFEISANSFFQTNTRGAETLYNFVKEYAGLIGNETVFDLYCGTGTISIFLSAFAERITGFEIVERAVADAKKNCEANGISNCRFILGDIRTSLSEISEKPDVMIIDPPRAGMHKDVVKQVLAMGPSKIVYVSCNPATLARDVGLMKDHYAVLEVQPVDMFPHTFHVEAVAGLEKIKKNY
ncbi:MAG: 23S rRNA (uracil(1939)-C(5))-methyltransferase RlmD [Deltaproteobacteria bacterium]|nr:23S rRNA (uracil(1939)-C(5))-methyltransferase RlmD [Deltaproteobacteria bacterium]